MTYDKVILVTGGAGFIGANYLNTMVPRYPKYRFVNVDALTYAADPKNIRAADAPNYVFVKADIRDTAKMNSVFKEFSPTDIIHFAAESHVDNSIAGPRIFVETNILGTHNLLELARTNKLDRFHQISTDEVYGSLSFDAPPTTEESPIVPNSPYSASKASADLLVRAYHRTFGLNTIITRASNNYGPLQHREKLIPLFISNLAGGKKVPLYGDGKNMRDWLYVGDHVEGIDTAFHNGRAGEIYNLGGGNALANIVLTKKILAAMELGEEMIERVADRPGHDLRYAPDASKAKRELGWEPKKDLDEGLRETIEFYSA